MTDQQLDQAPQLEARTGLEVAKEQLETFINSPALVDMADLFGVAELPSDAAERISVLRQLAESHWDFRKGVERQAVDWNDELVDQEGSEQWNRIFAAADSLGMVASTEPKNKNPDYVVVLGGANKAPYDRLRFALEQVDSFGHVAYLGSSRQISDAEREKAKDYAPDAQTEFDLGCGAFETILGARMVDEIIEERDGDTWGMRLYEFEVDGVTKNGFVLSTPQIIGERRATTYDNYAFFAERAELDENPDTSIVAATTGFYVPGQHLPGVQQLVLPYNAELETIGHSAEYSGVTRKASQLLQEMKSAIDAATKLHDTLQNQLI